jgi:ubiquinone/menaquinone biosynthesis C-methylase UbiE
MGIYEDKVLPRVIDKVMDNEGVERWRNRALEGVHGDVLEIGFGSGLNMKLYPAEVTRVFAVDPAVLGQEMARPRVEASGIPVDYVGLDGQNIDLPDDSVDSAVSTFTLCTIPDPVKAVEEVRRILKPGGTFHFVEHGEAPDERVVKWQKRVDYVWKYIAGGCHVGRDMIKIVQAGGFKLESSAREYADGPKTHSAFYVGRAS